MVETIKYPNDLPGKDNVQVTGDLTMVGADVWVPQTTLQSAVQGSGSIVYTSGALWVSSESGTWYEFRLKQLDATAPPNALLHFPQSGYDDVLGEYPVDGDAVDGWNKTHDSSGLVIGSQITAAANRESQFENDLGGAYAKLFFQQGTPANADAFLHNGGSNLYVGNMDVCTFGIAMRTPSFDPSGTAAQMFTLLNNVGGFTINCMIRTSGTFRVGFHDGTNLCRAHSATVAEANKNYYITGLLKSDGTIKIFINGVDDTFNNTNTFSSSANLRAGEDFVIAAGDTSYNGQASGYFISDLGIWLRDFEETGELIQLHRYMATRYYAISGGL